MTRIAVARGRSEPEETFAAHLRWQKMPVPIREFVFHPTRKWRFDFAWPTYKVAVEVEGGTWVNGAHARGAHFESDATKYNEAAILGWIVLRVTTKMVDDGRAIEFALRALHAVSSARGAAAARAAQG